MGTLWKVVTKDVGNTRSGIRSLRIIMRNAYYKLVTR
jgi:hypothetical protein